MAGKLAGISFPGSQSHRIFLIYGAVILLSIFAGIATGWYFLAGVPAVLLLAYLCIVDFRTVFYLLLLFIPLSTEVYLPNGFGTDLPTEPLIVGLMLVYFIYVLPKGREMNTGFLRHPLTLLLLLHVFWIFISTITSNFLFVSVKFSLAKIWYVTVFFFLAGSILNDEKDFRKMFWVIFIPLMFTVLITVARHAAYGFSFQDVHKVFHPFQRNHVNYAATLTLFFPFVWLAIAWYPRWSRRWWILAGSIVILLAAIYLSYTRAAYVALGVALGAYYIIRLRLMRHLLAVALTAAIGGFIFMAKGNTYLQYAPNYDRTITHTNFDNLIEATYKMEDISTMERVYRWVAGFNMTRDNPLVGFGPGNFVNFYKSYTVTSFQTYVSDNKEMSGIHSYHIMTLVEQGIIGLIIFLALTFYTLIYGENLYHRMTDLRRRRIVLMVLLCLVVINSFLIINDLIETDKIGSFFFLSMAVLINMDLAENSK
jgi:O-antigen ligase